jgi:transcriptional regulator with GAF, ATPase, and Fis domain
LLAYHFLRIHAKKLGKAVSTIPKTEMEKLIKCQWPGNVRELENIIERSVILSKGKSLFIVEFDQLENLSSNLEMTLAENERQHILKTLEKTDWKVAGSRGAAKMLGIPASTLSFHMKKLGIIRP